MSPLVSRAIVALFLALSINSSAHEAKRCDNSCWLLSNQSDQESISISCRRESSELFSKQIPKGRSVAWQADRGYGDGMGYPEPNVSLSCTAQANNDGPKTTVQFNSLGWGDHIRITLSNKKLCVTSKEYWHGDKTKTWCEVIF